MTSKQIAPTAANDVTNATLRAGPARLLAFLQGLADPAIRARFAAVGWSDAQAHEAWDLLLELKAGNLLPATPHDAANPILDAIAACDAWASTGLIRARALLQLHFPEQAAFVFANIQPAKGIAVVLDVSTFLERRSALDPDARAVLEDAGVTNAVATRLAALVRAVRESQPPPVEDPHRSAAARTVTLRKIHAWLTAWTEIARTVITRRDHLIRLGIAKRRFSAATARAA